MAETFSCALELASLHAEPDESSERVTQAMRGEPLLVEAALGTDEWLAGDLVGCTVPGLGPVTRVLEAPSCHLLELEDGSLVPLVGDAVRRVDTQARIIEVDRRFLDG